MEKDIPSKMQAEKLLAEAEQLNPGPWVSHSRFVAQGAQIIAKQLTNIDPERAYILGLLHDIGRRFGMAGMRHVIDGFRFLKDQGFPAAARICLTHSYPKPDLIVGASPWDGSEADYQFIVNYLSEITYNDYDRIVQLCDAITLPQGFCLLEKRLVDVIIRHGSDEHTSERFSGYFAIKDKIESRMDCSVYSLLPDIVANTFEGALLNSK